MSETFFLTLWRSFSRGRRGRYTWREFVDTFVQHPEVVRDKRRVAGFSLASFEDNRRALSRVEQVFGLALDFDGGDTTLEQAAGLLPGVQGVAYTTFSHSEAHPKLRVVFLLSRPVDAVEYEHIWYWVSKKVSSRGHVLDESARDASRFWYLPSHPPGAPYAWRELYGKPLDVSAALKDAPTPHNRSIPGGGLTRLLVASSSGNARDCVCPASESFFGRAFTLAGMAFEPLENEALPVICPWSDAHTSGHDGDTSTVILPPTTDAKWGFFHCSHAHCVKRRTLDLLDTLPSKALESARREHGSGLIRACVRAGFVQRLEAIEEFTALDRFVLRCYPLYGGAPLIWTVKIGSRAHVEGLEALSLGALRRRRVDLAVRKREITWGRLSPDAVI